ncbi:MAG: hypothetical protein Tsb0034_09450 [Ekhidna sp.]
MQNPTFSLAKTVSVTSYIKLGLLRARYLLNHADIRTIISSTYDQYQSRAYSSFKAAEGLEVAAL